MLKTKTKMVAGIALLLAATTFSFVSCGGNKDTTKENPIIDDLPADDSTNKTPEDSNSDDEEGKEEETSGYSAPDLSGYYKKYFVTTDTTAPNFDKAIGDWGAGSNASKNADGTYTISASESMWSGIGGIAAPFTGLDEGVLSNYEYLVLTLDLSEYTLNTDQEVGNYGVNIKIPDAQVAITNNWVSNSDGTRTYYAKISDYANAPTTATELAVIIGGSGSLVIKDFYAAAESDPANKPVTAISISPASISVKQGETASFVVKDSNLKNVTDSATYSIKEGDTTGSSVSGNVFTAGSSAGTATVVASYTVDENTFTAEATVTVLGALVNKVATVELEKYTDAAGNGDDKVSIVDNVVTLDKPQAAGWGTWSNQLFLTIKPESGNMFENGHKYLVELNVTSSATVAGAIWKGGDTVGYILQENITYEAGVKTKLSKEVDFSEDFEAFQSIFAFGDNQPESTITISDISVYDITE